MRVGVMPNGSDAVPDPATDRVIEVGAIGRALWRKKWWMIAPTLAVAALAFATVNVLTPKYRSEARVLIESRENVFLRPEAEKAGDRDRSAVDQEAVTSQVQLALSRDLARRVIRQLKLGERPEFDPLLRGSNPLTQILRLFGLVKDPLRMTPEERVLESYYERLSVFPVDKSRVIAIELQSSDPELAALAANAVAEAYLAIQQALRLEETRAAGRWLGGEIEVLRQRVAEAEARVESFRTKSNLFVGTNNTTLSNQQLGELNSQLAAARSQKADAEAKARFIREALRTGKSLESADFLNSELIRRLAEQRATLRAQLAEQSSTLLDGHPRIKELKAQIADLERQVRMEGERLARSLENDAGIAGTRVDTLSSNLDQLKKLAASTNEQDIQLRALDREAKAQRDLLESYLAKYREISSRDNLGALPSDIRIISRALVSNTPFFPKKLPIVLIATLAMLVVAAAFIATAELLSGSVGRPVTAASDRAEPTLVARGEPGLLIHDDEDVPLVPAEADRAACQQAIAATAKAIRDAGEAGRRIVVAGATRHVGTTLTAIALARALGQDARVVLIDLALDHPNLAALAVDPSSPGWADLVRGSASFGQIITRDRDSRVHLVLTGRVADDDAAIFASERLSIALDALGRSYDHLVIDAGTLPDGALAPFVRRAPRAILVAGSMPEEATNAALERLAAAGFSDVTVLAGPPPLPDAERSPLHAAAAA